MIGILLLVAEQAAGVTARQPVLAIFGALDVFVILKTVLVGLQENHNPLITTIMQIMLLIKIRTTE